ncbi:MAG: phosphotransferase family protein [Acidimicrobiales bacterium]
MDTSQRAPEGVHVDEVTAWLVERRPVTTPPLRFELVAGGRSNLTFVVTDATGARVVLRRPPLGHVLASAHDMGREHRVIAALAGSDVPVPTAVGLSGDSSVNGAPFYVMDHVEGHVLRDAAEAGTVLDEAARRRAGESVVDVLARIHAVDIDAVGLGDLGRRDDYVGRQLKRWYGQFQRSNALTGRPVPLVHQVHDRLAATVPEQQGSTIVHGDYRLDNCMVDGTGEVVAVLDWELCTLGDPLADLGVLLVYWAEPGDTRAALPGAPTALPGFLSRAELIDRYAEQSGRDLDLVPYYVAFGYWKLACILEGVYARYANGAMGATDDTYEAFDQTVVFLAEQASAATDELG